MIAQRMIIVGTSGCGKTALARRLANHLTLKHIELDALYWQENWQQAPTEEFRRCVSDAVADDCWIADGNYSKARDLLWSRASTIIWLDYPILLVLWRLFVRTLTRSITREQLWKGNRERLSTQFFTRDSLFLWAITSCFRYRRQYPELLESPQYSHLQVVRLRNPQDTEAWLKSMAPNEKNRSG